MTSMFFLGYGIGAACMWLYFRVSGLIRTEAEWRRSLTPSQMPEVHALPWDYENADPTAQQLIEAMGTAICEMGESDCTPLQFKQHRLLLEGRKFLKRAKMNHAD